MALEICKTIPKNFKFGWSLQNFNFGKKKRVIPYFCEEKKEEREGSFTFLFCLWVQ